MGTLVWELLAGRRRFGSAVHVDLMMRIVEAGREEVPVEGLPRPVEEVVTAALAPRPRDRPSTESKLSALPIPC